MAKQSLLILTVTASVCAALPALGQAIQPTPGEPGNYVLPEGGAKALVQQNCTICHDLRQVVNSNKSPDEWQNTVNMMKSAGATMTQEESSQIRNYLMASFPEKPRPKPVLIAGSVQVEFKQWPVPTPGSRPHDPLAMPDGTIWWSGQYANVLGRLDPKTGA